MGVVDIRKQGDTEGIPGVTGYVPPSLYIYHSIKTAASFYHKDLSRFGRDYIECGKYIEKIFPQLGVRFISVNDGYDTAASSSTDSLVIPFKNLINDSYSRDISIKVRTNLEVKRRQGEFISNFAVYGYCKDPADKNHLIVDEYAADVVQNIFKWKIEGLSPNSIAVRLNKLGILSPMEYKRSHGSRYSTKFKKNTIAEWSHVAVRRILQNEVYTGVLVQGKRTTPNYKTKKFVYRNEDEWVRVEGTHEAIISRPQFDLVQKLLLEDTRAGAEDTAVHPYCGRIFCADCGAPAVRKTVRSGDRQYVYYVCSANKSNREACSIPKKDLLDKPVSKQLDELMRRKKAFVSSGEDTVLAAEGGLRTANAAFPISCAGDLCGMFLLIKDEDAKPGETQEHLRLGKLASDFLSRETVE